MYRRIHLYSANVPSVSNIILVHGLFGDAAETWTAHPGRSRSPSPNAPHKTSTKLKALFSHRKNSGTKLEDRLLKAPDLALYPSTRRVSAAQQPGKSIDEGTTDPPARSSSVSDTLQVHRSRSQDSVYWPRDLLPVVIPNSNILTWGYDADINHLFTSASQNTSFHHAGSLLADVADRQEGQTNVRFSAAMNTIHHITC